MSLFKSFQIDCEANVLRIRREIADGVEDLDATRPARRAAREGCVGLSSVEYTAKDARATAKRAGWIRHWESIGQFGKAAFDVCPVCAPKVIPDHIPAKP